MTVPSNGATWRPVDQLVHLDVVLTRPAGGEPRVELVDRRLWLELVSLAPGEAGALATVLAERAWRAGWTGGKRPYGSGG